MWFTRINYIDFDWVRWLGIHAWVVVVVDLVIDIVSLCIILCNLRSSNIEDILGVADICLREDIAVNKSIIIIVVPFHHEVSTVNCGVHCEQTVWIE